ncbi:hypothetical protein C0J52_20922 [Blattella germanica]|nr:hypothetical protein C0J52_20922 [Blattella germanica]
MAFYLQSIHSRMYVEVRSNEQDSPVIMAVLCSAEDGKFVIVSEPQDTPRQKWSFGEDLTIVNDLGQALDVRGGSKEAGAEVIVWPKHGQDNQKFRVVPKNKPKE